MTYVLEGKREYKRLEKQSQSPNYNVELELASITFRPDDYVLDAGCGSGLLSRYLKNNYGQLKIDACDFSEQRIADAKTEGSGINFFQSDLSAIGRPEGIYSKVICRYVFEHLNGPQKVSNEFYRILKPKGQVVVINVDAIMFDIYSENKVLNQYLELIKKEFPIDIFAGRKVSTYLFNSGFTDITWDISPMVFNGQELEREVELIKERFSLSKGILINILGSEDHYHFFVKTYLETIQKKHVPFFYNKFICTALKK